MRLTRKTTLLVSLGVALLIAIVPFSSACSCIPQITWFRMAVLNNMDAHNPPNIGIFSSDKEVALALKERLEGLQVERWVDKTAQHYSHYHSEAASWIDSHCPVKDESDTEQHISCNLWLEHNLVRIDRGWLVLFSVSPGHIASRVSVERIYGINGRIIYSSTPY